MALGLGPRPSAHAALSSEYSSLSFKRSFKRLSSASASASAFSLSSRFLSSHLSRIARPPLGDSGLGRPVLKEWYDTREV